MDHCSFGSHDLIKQYINFASFNVSLAEEASQFGDGESSHDES